MEAEQTPKACVCANWWEVLAASLHAQALHPFTENTEHLTVCLLCLRWVTSVAANTRPSPTETPLTYGAARESLLITHEHPYLVSSAHR